MRSRSPSLASTRLTCVLTVPSLRYSRWAISVLDRPPAISVSTSAVVASEELDGERGWRMLASGELAHVRPDLTVESAVVIPEPPAHLVPLPADNPNIDT